MNINPTFFSLLCIFAILGTPDTADARKFFTGWVGTDFRGIKCKGKPANYGPFDYTISANRGETLDVVERHHFNENIDTLRAGMTGQITDDLDYTLRAFPNHHKALWAMARYDLQTTYGARKETIPRAECYFERALHFAPKDGYSRMIFAIFQHKKGMLKEAEKYYKSAITLIPKSSEVHNNYGLLLVDLKKIDEAKKQNAIAQKLGYPLDGLAMRIRNAQQKPKKEKQKASSTTEESPKT